MLGIVRPYPIYRKKGTKTGSFVVVIPKEILEDMGIKSGVKLVAYYDAAGRRLIYSKVDESTLK